MEYIVFQLSRDNYVLHELTVLHANGYMIVVTQCHTYHHMFEVTQCHTYLYIYHHKLVLRIQSYSICTLCTFTVHRSPYSCTYSILRVHSLYSVYIPFTPCTFLVLRVHSPVPCVHPCTLCTGIFLTLCVFNQRYNTQSLQFGLLVWHTHMEILLSMYMYLCIHVHQNINWDW